MNSQTKKHLKDARSSLAQAMSIIVLSDDSIEIELAQVKAAAIQAQQAANSLNMMAGVMALDHVRPCIELDMLNGNTMLTASIDRQITELDIPGAAKTVLHSEEIYFVGQLISYGYDDVLCMPNMGRQRTLYVQQALAKDGLQLGTYVARRVLARYNHPSRQDAAKGYSTHGSTSEFRPR